MRNPEERTQEFIRAAQDLHAAGEPRFYLLDVSKQIARNDEAYMRRREITRKVLRVVGVTLNPEPMKWFVNGAPGTLYPIAARLERVDKLESIWEDLPASIDPDRVRRRLYRLVEEPETQAA